MGLSKGLEGYNYTYNVINNIFFPYGVGSGGTPSTITVDGLAHTMLTFTSTGTFTVTTAGMFDCMIMGGGSSGTQNGPFAGNGGGGGGAGALVISQENYFDVGTYVVAVGGGGSISYVGKYASGRPLGPSQGGGGNANAGSPIVGGFSGGSGIGVGPNGNANGGGGGGGMGAAGTNANTNKGYGTMTNGGNGGAGVDWSLWRGQTAGTTYYGAGGGGSGGYAGSGGSGGTGGGGTGGGYYSNVATGGAANTGSGGGGGTEGASARAGGSGLVLIRFRN